MKQPIDLRPDHASIVHDIIARHLPGGVSVRVFGSRAKWSAKPHSDLDLALKGKGPLPRAVLSDLAEAFSESDLPFRVDVVDWHSVAPSFQAVIDRDGVAFGWQIAPLDDCLESLIDYRGKSPTKSVTGIPVLSAKVVKTTGLLRPIEQTIAPDYYPKWMTRGIPRPGDVVMTTEAPMGEVIQLDNETSKFALGQRIVCMRGKAGKLDNTFLRYLLTSPKQQEILASYATGTTVLGISQKALRSVPISFPAFEEQTRIGDFLSALDDKIELNRRMNETLEGQAQAIFRDWFVDFGPVRRAQAGEADPVAIMGGLTPDPARAAHLAALFPAAFGNDGLPVGWQLAELADEFNLTMGQSPPGDTYNDVGNGLPFFQGRTDFGFRYPENRKFCSAPDRVADTDDTLISVRAPVGDLNMAWERCCIGRGVAAARHKSGASSFTFYTMRTLQPELQIYEHTGTVFGAINRKQFEKLPVVDPGSLLVAEFEKLAGAMDQRLRAATIENRTLAETRDYLLPRLMSGKVRVADAERAMA